MRDLQFSFGGGVISPEMQGRVDSRVYANGLADCTNFLVKPQGPAVFRPGFRHVATAYSDRVAGSTVRLTPFIYNDKQSYVVEFGEKVDQTGGPGYLRIHTQGGTLLWATARRVGDLDSSGVVDTVSDRLTFDGAHDLVPNQLIRLWSTGTLPGGVSSANVYRATIVDACTITLVDDATSLPVDITSTGSGVLFCVPDSELPHDYIPPVTYDTSTGDPVWGSNRLNFTTIDPTDTWEDATAVRFSGTASNLPAEIDPNKTYYIWGLQASGFYLVEDLQDPQIVSLSAPFMTGPFTLSRHYEPGELILWTGGTVPDGVHYCFEEHTASTATPDTTKFFEQPRDATLVIPTPYTAEAVPDLHYVQTADVQTLVHRDHAPHELRRYSATRWACQPVVFAAPFPAPQVDTSVTVDRGRAIRVNGSFRGRSLGSNVWENVFKCDAHHGLAKGDVIYILPPSPPPSGTPSEGFYYIDDNQPGNNPKQFSIVNVANGIPFYWGVGGTSSAPFSCYYSSLDATPEQSYRITAVDANDRESVASDVITANNLLYVEGASNTFSWSAVPGATKYRVYKQDVTGLYGFLGEVDAPTVTFTDDNIKPDLARTLPVLDQTVTSSSFKPGSVAYLEQRRVFGGTDAYPQTLFFSRTGAPSDFTFHIPLIDDDRIQYELAANRVQSIRHLVTMADLILLTESGEWRVTSVNSDAITPTTISARQQSTVGASWVQPVAINNVVLFAAARGGHVREMGYNGQANGYRTHDVSLRAAHLFDGHTIRDMAYQESPFPVVWAPSSSGKLLGLTYVPEEQIGAWHTHDLGGDVLSVANIPEGDADALYAAVDRAGVVSIEQMLHVTDATVGVARLNHLDRSTSTFGAPAQSYSVTLSVAAQSLASGSAITITASAVAFCLRDIGDDVILTYGGVDYRARVASVQSGQEVTAHLMSDMPASIRSATVSEWRWARRQVRGLHYLAGESVRVVADGELLTDSYEVGQDGILTLRSPAADIHVGVTFQGRVETLPRVVQADGAGQGRAKNVSKLWIRLYRSLGLRAGPSDEELTPVADELTTGEREVRIGPTWSQDGRVVILQDKPHPATVVSLSADFQVAG